MCGIPRWFDGICSAKLPLSKRCSECFNTWIWHETITSPQIDPVKPVVEHGFIDSATRAREALNGCDIYSGCCTLKIDYAKPEKLNVYKNDTDSSWDYTLEAAGKDACNGRAPLLHDPTIYGGRPTPY
ncbi:hypothetical protein pipiens_013318, partial [Culex pipiens pipiens]